MNERKYYSRGIESIELQAELKRRLAEQEIWQEQRQEKEEGKCEGVLREQRCKENMLNKPNWWWNDGWNPVLGEELAALQDWVNGMGEISQTKEKEDYARNNQGLKANPATRTKCIVQWTQVT